MNHELLKAIIYDQHRIIRESRIMPRPYVFDPNANYVLVGLRRAGKSTLLYKIAQDLAASGVDWNRIIYINFEDERLSEFTAADFNDILAVQSELSAERGFFFFDEIQNVSGWEKFARRMADSREHTWITGSNARMLSGEIETVLGGRYLTKYVRPYSFPEYLDALGVPHTPESLLETRAHGRITAALQRYLQEGGFPEALLYTARREYLTSVFQKILLGDIVARNGLRNAAGMQLLIKKTAESLMNEVSFTKLHGTLKSIGIPISKDAVIDYIGYAKDAYLLFPVHNWFTKFSERESSMKYYFTDNGILNLFLIEKSNVLLENLAAAELTRRYPDGVFYLSSSRTGIDVDFFIPEAEAAVQVCLSLSEDAWDRETGNLVRLAKSMEGVRRLFILTLGESRTVTRDGFAIRVIPADRFLLDPLQFPGD